MTLVTIKSKSIPKRAIIGLEQEQAGAVSRSGAYAGAATNTSQVRATSADKSTGFLDDKLTVGQGITKNVITDVKGTQKLELSASASGTIAISNPSGLAAGIPVAISYYNETGEAYLVPNTTSNYPIGIITAGGATAVVQFSGVYDLASSIFADTDYGLPVYWSGSEYTTVYSTAFNSSVGVVVGAKVILIQIAPIDTHKVSVNGTDSAKYLKDKLIAGNRMEITEVAKDNGVYLSFDSLDEVPTREGQSGKLLTNNGVNPVWDDTAKIESDKFTVKKALNLTKQGNETGGAAEQTIYMPQYSTIDGVGGLFVRNSGGISINGMNGAAYLALNNSGSYVERIDGSGNYYGLVIMPYGTHRGAYLSTPESSSARRVLVTDDNSYVYRAPAGDHVIKTASITLTRAQILALYTTPVQLMAARAGVCVLPLKAIQKQGTSRYYTGIISVCFGTTYSSSKVLANVGLAGAGASARFVNCVTPTTSDCENVPIYLTASSTITDGGTSDSVTFYLEYTEIYL